MGTSSVRKDGKSAARRGGTPKKSKSGGSGRGASRTVKAADLCKELGIQPYVLKFWETEFPQLADRIDEKRLYDAGAIDIAREIHRLIDLERKSLVEARRAIDASHPSAARARGKAPESRESASIVSGLRLELQEAKRRIAMLERENLDLTARVGEPAAETRGGIDPGEVEVCLTEARSLARDADELVRELIDAAAIPEDDDDDHGADDEIAGADRSRGSLFPPDS